MRFGDFEAAPYTPSPRDGGPPEDEDDDCCPQEEDDDDEDAPVGL
jgi:hypothetical protein